MAAKPTNVLDFSARQATSIEAEVPEAAMDPHRLARAFLHQHGEDAAGRQTLRFWRGEWWRFERGRYRTMTESELRSRVTACVKDDFDTGDARDRYGFVFKVTKGLIANVIQALASLAQVSDATEQPVWLGPADEGRSFLAVSNGLLDIEKALAKDATALARHNPNWFSAVCIPVCYDPVATCPRFQKFLGEVLEQDSERIALIQEWFGYLLTSDTSQQKFVILEGEGANGKTVLLETLTQLLGKDNVSHVPLEIFGQRFQLTVTLGKLANIASEVGEIDKVAEGTLKAFTSGDRMYFDRKGIPGIHAYPTARLVLATNNRPRFRDQSSGIWRRVVLVPFRVTIPPERQDRGLVSKLTQELPGILNFALEGLRRLRAQGGFSSSRICVDAVDEYRLESNPERQFLGETYRADPAGVVPGDDVYRNYCVWCEGHGYRSENASVLGKEMLRVFPNATKARIGGRQARQYVYKGIA